MPVVSSGAADLPSRHGNGPGAGRGTLPKPLTSFIGRERELAQARRLLQRSHLVTLTGPGGSGKTRLCLALAADVAADYPDGVYFVPLAPVRDPELVPSTIAQGIGLQDPRDQPLMEHLVSQLRDRRLLILLDNFEHLLAGAAVVTRLLRETGAVRILVSSRSPLRIEGEQEYPVPPLAVPDPGIAATAESLGACESVRLFAERAAARLPGFTVGDHNAPAVAEITRRLDGLPLAIELAAARVNLLPPEAILPRLEHSLGLLTGGSRDLPDRQRTLRATISWSYDLLTERAKRLLAACSVFAGGATLDLIETVCGAGTDPALPVFEGLTELIDQSLMRQLPAASPSVPRYAMLETIREYAAERLNAMPAADMVRGRHAAAFLGLVEAGGRPQAGLATKEWLERVGAEHNNIRAALAWYGRHEPATALRLAAAMAAFWSLRGHHTEGRQRLSDLLGQVSRTGTARIGALNGAAWLAIDQGDYAEASRLLGTSITLAAAARDVLGEGIARAYLGRCKMSRRLIGESAAEVERAAALVTEANDGPAIAFTMMYSALIALLTGRLEAASDLFGRCATMALQFELAPLGARATIMLGYTRLELGDLSGARLAITGGLPAAVDAGDRWIVPLGLSGFAGHAAKTGRPHLALRLAGAAEAYQDANKFSMPDPIAEMVDRWLAPARTANGAARALAAGRQLSADDAVRLALRGEPDHDWRPGPSRTLTRREAEVAALAARGLSNKDIAARLFLSVRTVEAHIDHVLTKLGFHTRSQLAVWAHEQGLVAENK